MVAVDQKDELGQEGRAVFLVVEVVEIGIVDGRGRPGRRSAGPGCGPAGSCSTRKTPSMAMCLNGISSALFMPILKTA